MPVYYGPNTAKGKDLYYGDVKIKEAYYGSTKVYSSSKQFTYNGSASSPVITLNLSEVIPSGTRVRVQADITNQQYFQSYFYNGSSVVSDNSGNVTRLDKIFTLTGDASQLIFVTSMLSTMTYTVTITY